MIVRIIYDPEGIYDVFKAEVEAPDFASALREVDIPKELSDGDLLVQEHGKGQDFSFYQIRNGSPVAVGSWEVRPQPTCTKCGLCKTSFLVKVPHTWSKKRLAERPLVMLVGMALGREEAVDRTCFDSTAPAGNMLRALVKDAGVEEHEIVYSNITKCFPTGAHGEMRDPEPEEMKACAPYLFEEIEDLKPGIIVVAGSLAANFFLGTTGDKITQIRGRVYRVLVEGKEYKVIPIIHPSAVVRTGRQDYADFIRADLRAAKSIALARAEFPNWHLVNDTEEAVQILWKVRSLFDRKLIDSVALDIETNDRLRLGTDKEDEEFVSMALWDPEKVVLGVSLAWDDDNGYFIPLHHPESKVDVPTFMNVFKQVFAAEYDGEPLPRTDEPVPLTTWNGRYDQSRLYVKYKIKTKLKFDGMLGSYCVHTNTRKHGLKNALSEVYHWPPYNEPLDSYLRTHFKGEHCHYGQLPLEPDPEKNIPGLAQYACYDATGTWKIRKHFEAKMDTGLRSVHDLLCLLSDYLVENESRCAVIDVLQLEKIERDYPKTMEALLSNLDSINAVVRFSQKFGKYNPAAPHQVRVLMFGEAICKNCNFNSHSAEFSKMLEEKHTYCSECGSRSYRYQQWWNCPNRHKVKQVMQIRQPLVFDTCPKCFSRDVEKDEYLGFWPKGFTDKGLASTGESLQLQCLYEIAKYDDQKRLATTPGNEDRARFILNNRTYKKMQKIYGYTKTIRRFTRPRVEEDMISDGLAWLIYNYLIHFTATGRIATRDFSLHTAPAHSDIRRLFVSRWKSIGGLILSADYCLTGDTKISLLNGLEVSIQSLEKSGDKEFWVYSIDKNGKVVPGRAHSIRKTGLNKKIFRVWLDNGKFVRCTGNHPFLLRSGEYKRAEDLVVGDSLMPLYRRMNEHGYQEFLDPATLRWELVHQTEIYGTKVRQAAAYKARCSAISASCIGRIPWNSEKPWSPEVKVVGVEPDGQEDVYDLTVDGPHNFALSAGVFVHNSQLELRILACLADDENFRQAFCDGKDIHREVASRVFKVPYQEVGDALRRYAKCVTGDTVVETDKGSVAIKNLILSRKDDQFVRVPRYSNRGRITGKILTLKGYRRITQEYFMRQADVWKVQFDDGRHLKCTANHRFVTSFSAHGQPTLVPLSELKVGDSVLSIDDVMVQCRMCGQYKANLSLHVWRRHKMAVSVYAKKFGGPLVGKYWKLTTLPKLEYNLATRPNVADPKITSIDFVGKEDVFDLVEPEMRLFFTNGILTEDSCSFGIVYGETAPSLSEKTGLTAQEAEDVLNGIKYREFPGIGRFIDARHKEAHETGMVRTVDGRIFHLPDIHHTVVSYVNAAERKAQNYTIQAPASDLTARVCITHHEWYRRKKMLSRAWGFVHDAVESDIYPRELMPYLHALAHHMQDTVPNSLPYILNARVPLVAEFELGTRWDGGVKIKKYGTDWLEVEGPNRFFKETLGSLRMCYPDLELEILDEKPVKHTDEIVLRKAYEGDDGGDVVITAKLGNLL